MDNPDIPFEIALEELGRIVQSLERGQTTLDESLACFERGIELLRHCRGKLDGAEMRIRELVDIDENGRATLKPFDHQASADKTKSEAPKARRARREKPSGETADAVDDGGLFA